MTSNKVMEEQLIGHLALAKKLMSAFEEVHVNWIPHKNSGLANALFKTAWSAILKITDQIIYQKNYCTRFFSIFSSMETMYILERIFISHFISHNVIHASIEISSRSIVFSLFYSL